MRLSILSVAAYLMCFSFYFKFFGKPCLLLFYESVYHQFTYIMRIHIVTVQVTWLINRIIIKNCYQVLATLLFKPLVLICFHSSVMGGDNFSREVGGGGGGQVINSGVKEVLPYQSCFFFLCVCVCVFFIGCENQTIHIPARAICRDWPLAAGNAN